MTYVVLPALNESEALHQLIPDLAGVLGPLGSPYEILVVNDGSTDSTSAELADWAKRFPVRELTHKQNRGYGAAILTSVEWVLSQKRLDDNVVYLDCDNTHPPRYIPDLLRELTKGADVVTASYELPGGHVYGVPLLRRVVSRICNGLFRVFRPHPGVVTYTNGFRGYRVAALQKAAAKFGTPLLCESGFPGGVELFLKVLAVGGKPSEMPFDLHYENRGDASKIRFFKTITGYLRLIYHSTANRTIREFEPSA